MSLYDELAKAYARPSGPFRDAAAAIDVGNQAIEGYKSGAVLADDARKRKIKQQTLSEALGGDVPGLEGFGNTSVETLDELAKPITAAAALDKAMKDGKDARTPKLQQGQFQYNGMLTRFNPDPATGGYEALTPEGWQPIGTPKSAPGAGVPAGKSVPTGGEVSPRIPPTVPGGEADFFSKADTLKGIFNEIGHTFKPDYVGPVQSRVNRAVDVYTPYGNEDRSRFRNEVAKAFNNLIYLRSGKQINQEEASRMGEEFMATNNSPVAFQSALKSMNDEMNSLVANRRKALVQSGYRGASGLGDQNPQPFGGANVPNYATEQEAEASGHKGPAIIAGRRAVLQ